MEVTPHIIFKKLKNGNTAHKYMHISVGALPKIHSSINSATTLTVLYIDAVSTTLPVTGLCKYADSFLYHSSGSSKHFCICVVSSYL